MAANKSGAKSKKIRRVVALACTVCKKRNYNTSKNTKTFTERIQLQKYCPYCKAKTLHKEEK